MTNKLTAALVTEIFLDCLYQKGENTNNFIKVEGLVNSVQFNPVRLAGYKADICAMLAELPINFQQDSGGGWSFAQACVDRNGEQWTGLHQIMEQLVLLGIGSEVVTFILPREVWQSLPGGLPYFMVKREALQENN